MNNKVLITAIIAAFLGNAFCFTQSCFAKMTKKQQKEENKQKETVKEGKKFEEKEPPKNDQKRENTFSKMRKQANHLIIKTYLQILSTV